MRRAAVLLLIGCGDDTVGPASDPTCRELVGSITGEIVRWRAVDGAAEPFESTVLGEGSLVATSQDRTLVLLSASPNPAMPAELTLVDLRDGQRITFASPITRR
jgi:hypothetical protein